MFLPKMTLLTQKYCPWAAGRGVMEGKEGSVAFGFLQQIWELWREKDTFHHLIYLMNPLVV